MKLTELGAEWIRNKVNQRIGLRFRCPVCKGDKLTGGFCSGRVGVIFSNPFDGAPREQSGVERVGEKLDDLSLLRPMVVTEDVGCPWKGHVARGAVEAKR